MKHIYEVIIDGQAIGMIINSQSMNLRNMKTMLRTIRGADGFRLAELKYVGVVSC